MATLPSRIRVPLNHQQMELLRRLASERACGETPAAVLRGILPECGAPGPTSSARGRRRRGDERPATGEVVFEGVLEPGTGKAVPVRRGQVLRLTQLLGGQCADFNAFNLHDYRECFSAGRTRLGNLFPTVGDTLWSASPRNRPMFTIAADPCGTNDVNFPRCSGLDYERRFGCPVHTNCADIQAEAQREYGLTPDDVHDSLNLWMHVTVDPSGRLEIGGTRARRGDFVELIAHFDTLAVPNVCGDDFYGTSGYSLKPLGLEVLEATEEQRGAWLLPEGRSPNQRTPADFRQSEIRARRELTPDPGYRPEWPVYPVRPDPVEVELDREQTRSVERLRQELGAADAGEALRAAFLTWWSERRAGGPAG